MTDARLGAARRGAAVLLSLALLALPVQAQPIPRGEDGLPTLAPVLEEVTPAVVNISVTARAPGQTNPLLNDPFFREFFDIPQAPRQRPQLSAGSGVIVDAQEGYVLTNHHVIDNAREITVTLKDRRRVAAEVIGSDPATDIALLQIDAGGLRELELGDSDALRVGDYVVAIGNPFGIGQTVTSGIVSALGRSGLIAEGYEDFIQTDAPINPGNSGGALITLDGRLVGINTAIIAPGRAGSVGIGFAVPSNMARAVMDQLIEYGEVRRGLLGVTVQDLTPDLAEALGLDRARGALVTQVGEGSAAAAAGLVAGDVILSVDGTPVDDAGDLRNAIGLTRPGETVAIVLQRNGERRELTAEVGDGDGPGAGGRALERLAGAELRDLAPGDPLHGEVEGVLVAEVAPGSFAARAGLRPGDVILAVNRRPVPDTAALERRLAESRGTVALTIQRGRARLFLVLR